MLLRESVDLMIDLAVLDVMGMGIVLFCLRYGVFAFGDLDLGIWDDCEDHWTWHIFCGFRWLSVRHSFFCLYNMEWICIPPYIFCLIVYGLGCVLCVWKFPAV
jgi:hypothetical protein